ncbi:hypothetical protein SAMN05216308_105162 [Nitrosospira sp. Nsp13]|jgi:hypothetical protein|nr:hypothetical protein SAMN05216308_105162 [Nitrosospira sp. Nsp13]
MPALTPHPMLAGLACVISHDIPSYRVKMAGMKIIIHLTLMRESIILVGGAIGDATSPMIKKK